MRVLPSRTWRSTFSTTTIASSTTRPTDSTIARIVSRFRLKPNASMTIAAPTSETGIATSGTSAVRTEPMNRNTTRPTIRIVSMSVLVISFERVLHEHRRRRRRGACRCPSGSVGRMRSISSRRRCATSISFDADERPDAEVDAFALVVLGDHVGLLGAELDARDVAQAHDRAVAVGDDQVLELVDRAQVGVREQVDLDEVALGLADGGEVVVALQRRVHVAGREVERGEAVGIDPDAHRDLAAALDARRAARPASVASCGCSVRDSQSVIAGHARARST